MASTEPIEQIIDIGHTKVSVMTSGSGPDLVFVHGWPLHGRTWRNVVANLSNFTCHVIDMPGFGRSTATPQTPLTIDDHTASLGTILDGLGLEKYGLIGQDSGAMLTRFNAVDRPEVVGLGVIGSEIPGHHPTLVSLYSLLAKLPTMAVSLKLLLGNDFFARTPLVLGGAFHDKSRVGGDFRVEVLDPLVNDPSAVRAAADMIRHFHKDDVAKLADVHPKLTMPSVLIYGSDDPFFPVAKARAMTEQFAGSTTFIEIPDAKLLVYEEYPELVAGHLSEHFANLF